MLESTFSAKFVSFFLENKARLIKQYGNAGGIETKVVKGNTFNLRNWREGNQSHQGIALHKVSSDTGIIWKISDADSRVKPYDITFCFNGAGLLVIYFDKYREFFMIPIAEVPTTTSISYKYCKDTFETETLLPVKKEVKIHDF